MADKKVDASQKKNVDAQQSAGDAKILFTIRDNTKNKNNIEHHYMRAINSAKDRIVIANAYFLPGYRMLRAIRRAARRGVKVSLILQGQPDLPWVSALTRLLYGYLLKSGVVIHEYCKRPLHGKVAIVDDSWATVGSSNLDPLSLALNLEANVIIDSAAFNHQLHEHLHSLATAQCKPVDMKVAKHGYWWRMPFIFLSFHFLRHFPAMAGWLPMHTPTIKLMSPAIDVVSESGQQGNQRDNTKATADSSLNSVSEREVERAC